MIVSVHVDCPLPWRPVRPRTDGRLRGLMIGVRGVIRFEGGVNG